MISVILAVALVACTSGPYPFGLQEGDFNDTAVSSYGLARPGEFAAAVGGCSVGHGNDTHTGGARLVVKGPWADMAERLTESGFTSKGEDEFERRTVTVRLDEEHPGERPWFTIDVELDEYRSDVAPECGRNRRRAM